MGNEAIKYQKGQFSIIELKMFAKEGFCLSCGVLLFIKCDEIYPDCFLWKKSSCLHLDLHLLPCAEVRPQLTDKTDVIIVISGKWTL